MFYTTRPKNNLLFLLSGAWFFMLYGCSSPVQPEQTPAAMADTPLPTSTQPEMPSTKISILTPNESPSRIATPLPSPTATKSTALPSALSDESVLLPSPDGQWTAILIRETGSLEIESAQGEKQVVFLVGSIASVAKWSPDSRRLLFWSGPLRSASLQADGLSLWVLDAKSMQTTRLSETTLVNPSYQSWSPDGSALVFTNGGFRSAQVGKWLSLYEVDSGQVTTLISEDELVPGQVAWSSAFDTIAFAAVEASSTSEEWADWMGWDNPAIQARRIYLLDLSGGNYRRLNTAEANQDAPRWRADGKTLYYVQVDSGQAILMSADPETGEAHFIPGCQVPLPTAAGYYGQVDWTGLYESCPETYAIVVRPYSALESWQTYTSQDGSYAFQYPPDAMIQTGGVIGFPAAEPHPGLTPAEYIDQLKDQYPSDLCISIDYGLGFIAIRTQAGEKYGPPCGVTGLGDYETITKKETVLLGGEPIEVQGFEVYDDPTERQEKRLRAEFYMLQLPDGTRIDFGGFWNERGGTFQDYLVDKAVLLKILATYDDEPSQTIAPGSAADVINAVRELFELPLLPLQYIETTRMLNSPSMDLTVALHQDSDGRSYFVDPQTDTVVEIDARAVLSAIPPQAAPLTEESLRARAAEMARSVVQNFDTIQAGLVYEEGVKGDHFFFTWRAADSTGAMNQPFIQIGLHKSGVLFAYYNTLFLK